MHAKVSCTGCHTKPVFTDVGKDCANCHADIHRAQMGTNCAQCHTVLGWQVSNQAIQNHFNRFPLLGAHAVVQCDACHKNAAVGNYVGLSTACSTCHMSDWLGTTNPKHPSAGSAFAASNCTSCHSFDTWLNAKFDHSSTGFLLTARHANVPCALCHINNNYNLTIAPTDCGNSQCHLTTWQTTTNPVHPSAGAAFAAANCATCHTTVSWTTATFNHSTTGFPLTGAHVTVACNLCHTSSAVPPTDCYSCHTADWKSTTTLGGSVPDHTGNGFPAASTCTTCHTTTAWTGATFTHSWWKIPHQSATCATCHQTPGAATNFATFNCTNGCHTPESSWQQDSGHHNAGNYGPMTCTASGCHPNG